MAGTENRTGQLQRRQDGSTESILDKVIFDSDQSDRRAAGAQGGLHSKMIVFPARQGRS
jgi:hypothetical protein